MLTPDDIQLPGDFEIFAGADTGTFMSGLIVAISPNHHAFALEEFPNYHYAGGEIELTGLTVREWMLWFGTRLQWWTHRQKNSAWCDANTTFTGEVAAGLSLRRNPLHLELRTEITREYFAHQAVWLAPWLKVLPYEIEAAQWPDSPSLTSGRFVRHKTNDHTLDCLEHPLSRRPRTRNHLKRAASRTPLKDALFAKYRSQSPLPRRRDPHLGRT